MSWDKLSMSDKAKYIRLGVLNGISSLRHIRDSYNSYAEGGDKEHPDSTSFTKEEIDTIHRIGLLKAGVYIKYNDEDGYYYEDSNGRFKSFYDLDSLQSVIAEREATYERVKLEEKAARERAEELARNNPEAIAARKAKGRRERRRLELEEKSRRAKTFIQEVERNRPYIEAQRRRKAEDRVLRLRNSFNSLGAITEALQDSVNTSTSTAKAMGEAKQQVYQDYLDQVIIPTRDTISLGLRAASMISGPSSIIPKAALVSDMYGVVMDAYEGNYGQAAASATGTALEGISNVVPETIPIKIPIRGFTLDFKFPVKSLSKAAGNTLQIGSDMKGIYDDGVYTTLGDR